MEYNYIWEDCINKLDDLDYPIDNLSDAVLPVFPLKDDPVVGPLVIQLMTDIQSMEITLSEGKAMSIRYGLDDFLVFAFQRGYLFTGKDDTKNWLLAINFLIDELQMNRVLYYRRCHAKHSLISPNKNISVLNEKVETLCNEAGSYNPSSSLESNLQSVYQYVEQRNPYLLDRSAYSPEQVQKLAKYGEFCNSLYHDKKIMMIQVHYLTHFSLSSDWTSPFKAFSGTKLSSWILL
ncbi:uncharacterized protein [Blastocystis hominis]|uniref:Uncharacterized protein n=1 Tax=Blastocystis hominis TaxID=12968 RepID=D8M020_BLAHO|nr:uncharacterized protein [Blastocystis hominis]CBK21409.2 unnamed protein product [Blastocystis hominis]|eukprot:XP_012895457.1 uncharacterized protein [Blastocystis hominis]